MSMWSTGPQLKALTILALTATVPLQAQQRGGHFHPDVSAIVGATLIDGNGGPAVPDVTIVVRGERIAEIGPRATVSVPRDAHIVDAVGKFATPGFIDTNVHFALLHAGESMIRYYDRLTDVAAEAAQNVLKHGVTTVRDSYGALLPLIAVRDSIARGQLVGPRMLVAGNIVGWGGPKSMTMGGGYGGDLSYFDERMQDFITLGSGEELMDMTPEELRVAINAYLDRGPDFVKYGGTTHHNNLITFSPRQQRVIVEEVHKRDLVAEVHSTNPEPLRISILAGIDLIQHPEVHSVPLPDEIVELIVDRGIICSILQNVITGKAWEANRRHQERGDSIDADSLKADTLGADTTKAEKRRRTSVELRRERVRKWRTIRRRNAEKLIDAGCITTVSTDTYLGVAPEFSRDGPRTDDFIPGTATLTSIEGLVELGMTPSQAIVSATRNGAMACNGLEDFGTLEVGKYADILLVDADPLADIKNIRRLSMVMKEGLIVDRDALPEKPLFTAPPSEWWPN